MLNLTEIRQKLEEECASLQQRMVAHDSQRQHNNLDRADLAQSYARQERNALLADREQAHLNQIETALQKLENGRYGLCEECAATIAPGRLAALPYAELCIRCQSQR